MARETRKMKKFPVFKSDEEAEHFVDTADLTEYDFSQFKAMRFELQPKSERINMRLPKPLFDEVKARAERGYSLSALYSTCVGGSASASGP